MAPGPLLPPAGATAGDPDLGDFCFQTSQSFIQKLHKTSYEIVFIGSSHDLSGDLLQYLNSRETDKTHYLNSSSWNVNILWYWKLTLTLYNLHGHSVSQRQQGHDAFSLLGNLLMASFIEILKFRISRFETENKADFSSSNFLMNCIQRKSPKVRAAGCSGKSLSSPEPLFTPKKTQEVVLTNQFKSTYNLSKLGLFNLTVDYKKWRFGNPTIKASLAPRP